jgi:hypothetical protein
VLPWKKQHDDREPGRLGRRCHDPALVAPDRGLFPTLAPPAVGELLADARALGRLRRAKLTRPKLAVERKRLPVLDGRHAQPAAGTLEELLRRLGHAPRQERTRAIAVS